MRKQKNYDAEKDWRERTSTAVIAMIMMIVSLLLFVFGATMLSIWITNSEQEKLVNTDENLTIQAVRTHYNLEATYMDRCIKIKEDNEGKKYFIVVIGTRIFHAELHIENGSRIYNLKELEV